MPDALSRARAVEVGEKVAAYMRANPKCFQEQAALAGGISRRTYYEWLDGTSEAHEAFQALVLPAIMEQASAAEQKAEQDIACCESGSGAWANWHKWKLAQRYRKLFGDLAPQKVELTGKDGGALEVASLSMADLKARAKALLEGGGDE